MRGVLSSIPNLTLHVLLAVAMARACWKNDTDPMAPARMFAYRSVAHQTAIERINSMITWEQVCQPTHARDHDTPLPPREIHSAFESRVGRSRERRCSYLSVITMTSWMTRRMHARHFSTNMHSRIQRVQESFFKPVRACLHSLAVLRREKHLIYLSFLPCRLTRS